ncbi:suppressor of fused domain protein [Staphylospora marina]|uniref:suppressor of fused domain protein n=1 Tax=Staphylospora marina TaxID=2490858 RepID=UPI000F5B99D2|nr:suppressor of fused domain protein [Staphylospora marina]
MTRLFSLSGAPIVVHEEKKAEKLAIGRPGTSQLISGHIQEQIGPITSVYHEKESRFVHVDVHVVEPAADRPFYTLVTSGMSDLPMNVPDRLKEFRYAELMLCLPPDWKLGGRHLRDERYNWPIRWLRRLARLPHEFNTFLVPGHTVSDGEPPRPFAEGTDLCAMFVWFPVMMKNAASLFRLRVNQEKTIHFFSVIPLYKEELNDKLRNGFDALVSRFEEYGLHELVVPGRKNVCMPLP